MTDLLVLANLAGGPLHGYALKKQVGMIAGQGELHNNVIYPLLRRFEKNGWIARRTAAGERGQTREVYTLTKRGREELARQLTEFGPQKAASEQGFRLRVGMFGTLDGAARRRILEERKIWLAAHQERVIRLAGAVKADRWGAAVMKFLLEQIRAERRWIARLQRNI